MRPRQQQRRGPTQEEGSDFGGIRSSDDVAGDNEPHDNSNSPVSRASSPASTTKVDTKEKSTGRISPRRGGRLSPSSSLETKPESDEGHPSESALEEDRARENSNEDDGSRRTDSVHFTADEEAEPRWRAGAEIERPTRGPMRGREGSSGSMIVHEALVRERNEEEDDATFDELYQMLEEIGRGGLCTVYKIRKYPDKVGGSARRSMTLRRRRTSSTNFLQNLVGRDASHHAQPQAPAPLPAPASSGPPLARSASRGSGMSSPSRSTTPTGFVEDEPSIRDAVRRQLLARATSQHDNLSAPGTPTQISGGQQQPRRRTKNVRSLSSPSSLALSSSFWQRGDSANTVGSQLQPQRRLDVKTLRAAFKRSSASSARDATGGGGAVASSPEILYAVKVFNLKLLTPSQARQLKNEVEALKTLDHPSIIKAYETFTCKEAKQLMLVMELCTGGDLYARIPYQEADVSRVLYQVLSALIYMHDRNVVHRDLKLENIMFESKHPDAAIKLIDFGLAARFGSSSGTMLGTSSVLKERVGTLYCMAPCVLLGKGYTSKAGMWSVGVIAYTMLSGGNHPFFGKTPKQVVARILQGEYSFEGDDDSGDAWSHVSDDAKSFIRGLLRLEPEDRMSARQAIKHPWIRRQSVQSQGDDSLFWQQPVITEGVPCADQPTIPDSADSACGGGSTDEWKQRVTSEMVRYAEWSDFRKLALNVIAKRSTSDEIFEIRKVFADFDTENSGTITLDDFRSALTQYDPTYSDEELEDIFRKIDVGGTSVINYTEFLASALEARGSIEEWKLADAFDMLDRDGSGCISKDDLRRVVGDNADDSYLDELIAQAGGSTKDGRISYPEFLRAFSEQTHDLVYGMYEASRSRNRFPESDTSGGTDSILERRGLTIPRLISVTARQRLASRRRWLAAAAKSRLADVVLQVLTPTTKDDVLTYISTGRPNPR